jgi:hypothetical protein
MNWKKTSASALVAGGLFGADEAQAHYLRLISPSAANKGFMSHAMSGNYAYTARFKSVARDDATATAFWSEASEKHFKNDPEWKSRVAAATVGH